MTEPRRCIAGIIVIFVWGIAMHLFVVGGEPVTGDGLARLAIGLVVLGLLLRALPKLD